MAAAALAVTAGERAGGAAVLRWLHLGRAPRPHQLPQPLLLRAGVHRAAGAAAVSARYSLIARRDSVTRERHRPGGRLVPRAQLALRLLSSRASPSSGRLALRAEPHGRGSRAVTRRWWACSAATPAAAYGMSWAGTVFDHRPVVSCLAADARRRTCGGRLHAATGMLFNIGMFLVMVSDDGVLRARLAREILLSGGARETPARHVRPVAFGSRADSRFHFCAQAFCRCGCTSPPGDPCWTE